MTITPVLASDGKITHFIAVKEDITEHKQLEEQLRQARKLEAIGQLAGGIAHDFNNMLAIISGNAQLLSLMADEYRPEARECLKQITVASERAANLTRQLLAFGRKQAMEPKPLNLNQVIENLVKMLRRVIGEHIRLECSYDEHLPFVHADVGMLEQVLMNLTVNARDAMPRGGQLLITTQASTVDEVYARAHPEAREGNFVCLSVSDTGSGIGPEQLPHIFEPFYTTKEAGKGTGLGLATVYGLVKQHQGWIEVVTSPGQGAAFKIFLPAIESSDEGTKPQAETQVRGGTENILLVEDEEGVRLLTRRLLEANGYHVWEAVSGKEALEIWRNLTVKMDLLLTDIVMPDGVTGRELADQLCAQTPTLKVLFTSGYSREIAGKDTAFLRRSKSLFLQKPCPAEVLLETVRRCLDGTLELPEPEPASNVASHAAVDSVTPVR
jgi:nitrogen-specific signal transduction histidine kinase/CheY-like chemotaxis protein